MSDHWDDAYDKISVEELLSPSVASASATTAGTPAAKHSSLPQATTSAELPRTAISQQTKILPPALRPGSTIAIISPSNRLNDVASNRLRRAVDHLRRIGYVVDVVYIPLPEDATVQLSAAHRASELHQAFLMPHVSVVLCANSGDTANELLAHIDYDLIRKHAKIFVGLGDITVLHYALYTRAGLRTFYGPNAIEQLGEYPAPLTLTIERFLHAAKTTNGEIGQFPRSEQWTEDYVGWTNDADGIRARALRDNRPGWRWLRGGTARGITFGGCLPSMLQLAGTAYDLPSYEGVVLLVDVSQSREQRQPLPLEVVQAHLGHLANRGIFNEITGLVIGRPYAYDNRMLQRLEEIVVEVCQGSGNSFPILSGVDVGPTDPMVTVPLGAMGEMDSERDRWACVEPSVLP